jgi:hypothetical protein
MRYFQCDGLQRCQLGTDHFCWHPLGITLSATRNHDQGMVHNDARDNDAHRRAPSLPPGGGIVPALAGAPASGCPADKASEPFGRTRNRRHWASLAVARVPGWDLIPDITAFEVIVEFRTTTLRNPLLGEESLASFNTLRALIH